MFSGGFGGLQIRANSIKTPLQLDGLFQRGVPLEAGGAKQAAQFAQLSFFLLHQGLVIGRRMRKLSQFVTGLATLALELIRTCDGSIPLQRSQHAMSVQNCLISLRFDLERQLGLKFGYGDASAFLDAHNVFRLFSQSQFSVINLLFQLLAFRSSGFEFGLPFRLLAE